MPGVLDLLSFTSSSTPLSAGPALFFSPLFIGLTFSVDSSVALPHWQVVYEADVASEKVQTVLLTSSHPSWSVTNDVGAALAVDEPLRPHTVYHLSFLCDDLAEKLAHTHDRYLQQASALKVMLLSGEQPVDECRIVCQPVRRSHGSDQRVSTWIRQIYNPLE